MTKDILQKFKGFKLQEVLIFYSTGILTRILVYTNQIYCCGGGGGVGGVPEGIHRGHPPRPLQLVHCLSPPTSRGTVNNNIDRPTKHSLPLL